VTPRCAVISLHGCERRQSQNPPVPLRRGVRLQQPLECFILRRELESLASLILLWYGSGTTHIDAESHGMALHLRLVEEEILEAAVAVQLEQACTPHTMLALLHQHASEHQRRGLFASQTKKISQSVISKASVRILLINCIVNGQD
jgi:hypothetical protein